jgi:transposase
VFIRKLKSPNGKTYIQVVDKSNGKYNVVKSFGSYKNESEYQQLFSRAQDWINNHSGALELDFSNTDFYIDQFFSSITSMKRVGYDLLLGRIFDQIGFNTIKDEFFRELVLARVAFPKSKLKTTEFLYRYKQIDWDEDQLYRYLDKLHQSQKELVQQISYAHTLGLFNNNIGVVFYDVTTLYFEIDQDDDLRKTGFSKEGKHQNPQIILGLLVSKNGYPLAYEIFEGNKFEGHTMLPVVDAFKSKYNLDKLIIIADSGLLSSANIDELLSKEYEFILGARIKNESKAIKEEILSLRLRNGESAVIKRGDLKLVISYSDDRARKDAYNREKGLRRLEKQLKRGRLTKASINNRGYNKFLTLEGEISISLDRIKIAEDSKWDGLKGYISNADLTKDQIIENYQHLWQIEKAFRISKSDLKIRPIYHRLQRRIEAHICITFAAHKVYKELERQLAEKKSKISPTKAIEIAENIMEVTIQLPQNGKLKSKVLLLTDEQKMLKELFDFGC